MSTLLANLWQALGPHAANLAALVVCFALWLQVSDHDRSLEDLVDDVHEIEIQIAAVDREQAVRGQKLVELQTKQADLTREQERVRDLILEIIRSSPQRESIMESIESGDAVRGKRTGPFRRMLGDIKDD